MKKLLQLIFLFALTNACVTLSTGEASAQTNVYHPFPDSNAVWCDSICGAESYSLAGDTIISTYSYHKLILNGHYFQIHVNGMCDTNYGGFQNNYYVGAIRQDTAQRKIYFLAASSTQDTLLCDFSLTVGDTVRTYNTEPFYPNSVVTSIDSILIGTQYRKRWRVYMQGICGNWNAQIIEGIGSTYGLLDQRYPHGFCTTYGKLYCFSQNNQTFYPYYFTSSGCTQITGISDILNLNNQITIFPNPSTGIFTLKTSHTSTSLSMTSIIITTIFGEKIYETKISSEETKINLEKFSDGIYFLTLKTNDGIITKKLVKQ